MDIMWRIAEEKIRKAMKNGEFDQLPGFGKPLELDDLSHIPEELRIGYLMLKNAGYVTEDVDLKKELMTIEDLLRCCKDDQEKERLMRKWNEKLLRLNTLMKKRNWNNSRALREYQQRIEDKFRS
ncbi:DnaJ family domain-containing protein [Anoxybacteroides tepidamans]|uniref:DnaJ family domain-containing protein n=1 Tax=Anoxybacteroides tepidamans TaxID=265948 RepID=UPI0004885BD5|nr:DnaJ family domain-containing protein [Anoxybacillus tepidamans]